MSVCRRATARGAKEPRISCRYGLVAEILRTILRRDAVAKVLGFLGALSAFGLSLACLAAPSNAVVETAAGARGCNVASESCYGLQPRNVTSAVDGDSATVGSFGNAAAHPVLHAVGTYAIYWDPYDLYRPEWQGLIDGFFANLGSAGGQRGNLFATNEQYSDSTGKPAGDSYPFHGAYTDTAPYPSATCTDPEPLQVGAVTCLTDAQVRTQLETFVGQHGLPKGMGSIFYVLTPPGVTICLDAGGAGGHCSNHTGTISEETESYKRSFCSYHSDISPSNRVEGDASTILYAVVPWTAGGLGNYYILPEEPAYDCQDGGFNPTSKKPLEQKEHPKEHSTAENEAISKMSPEEKVEQAEKEQREGPHEEEPNQIAGVGWAGDHAFGLPDLIINQIAVEQLNTVTDPLLDAWQDSSHNEATDECRNWFELEPIGGSLVAPEGSEAGTLFNQSVGTGNYYLNDAFDLAADRLPNSNSACVGGAFLEPRFTATSPVNAGEVVGFDGMESHITLSATGLTLGTPTRYATYTWNFGDAGLGDETPVVSGYAPGSAPCETPWLSTEPPASLRPPGVWIGCAASVYHPYKYGGTYKVSLTVTDVGGNTASTTHEVTVIGAGPPASSSSSASGSGTTPVVSKVAPIPTASAAILSRMLPTATRSGLVVTYTVNEQVAGYFQVMLASSIDKRLGIGGAPAIGLPKGSPPERVIATAVLVTLKGGRSTVRIKFSKHTAERLDTLGRVALTLRLVAHNATSAKPVSVTVIRTVTLVH